MMTSRNLTQDGFALLLTLIVISVVLAVGLSLLHITMKQLTLSNVARDSEIAIHAARSGIECMQYQRQQPGNLSLLLDGGTPLGLKCFNRSATESEAYRDGNLYNYRYTYNLGADMCVETSLYLIDAQSETSDVTKDISTRNEGLLELTCTEGAVCTTIFSRGYNRRCDDRDSFLTVQRELTIQF
ncbi:hypothetical protein KC722_00045 [Candidatus Kaiserbacteria bacterium]|nr:hypothetical protein [Candidatus Kaiserbacteria bacterium]MCB9811346.1 hypothetical protein [Candidatus Nomurabacteria bacterium]